MVQWHYRFATVEEMVETIPPKELAYLMAVAEMTGYGDGPEWVAEIRAEIRNSMMRLAEKMGHSVDKEDFKDKYDLTAKWPWGPKRPRKPITVQPEQTAEQMEAQLKKLAGF